MCAKTAESPEKYREQHDFYQIAKPPLGKGPQGRPGSKVKEIERFLRWAIEERRPGFAEGETVGVAATAAGVGASRATVAQAIDSLVKRGMLQARGKAPYVIVSRKPRLDESARLGGKTMSIATALRGRQRDYFDRLVPVAATRKVARIKRFVDEQVRITPAAPEAISKNSRWRKKLDEVLVFRRLRVSQDTFRPFLFEVSFVCVDAKAAGGIQRQLDAVMDLGAESLSMFALLEHGAGIRGFVAGQTRLTVSPVEELVGFLLDGFKDILPAEVSLTGFAPGKPLMKWNYGIFVPALHDPLVILATSYVDTDELKVFVKTLEVEL